MELSIIIPVFRVEKTLRRCVDSITSQSYTDYEIILVDDGSPDSCGKICDELSKEDRRIKVIHRANGGLSAARNTGIDIARGKYITFADSDDTMAPETLKDLMEILGKHPEYDIIEYPAVIFYGSPEERVLMPKERVYTNDMSRYWHENEAYTHTYAWNKIYRRRLFVDVRVPEGKVFEDVWTFPMLLDRATTIATTNRGMYFYYANAGGITSNAGGRELGMLLEAHTKILENRRLFSVKYYMHVVNIQLDVYNLTGNILLSRRDMGIKELAGLKPAMFLKGLIIKVSDVRTLCRIHKTIRNLL